MKQDNETLNIQTCRHTINKLEKQKKERNYY